MLRFVIPNLIYPPRLYKKITELTSNSLVYSYRLKDTLIKRLILSCKIEIEKFKRLQSP